MAMAMIVLINILNPASKHVFSELQAFFMFVVRCCLWYTQSKLSWDVYGRPMSPKPRGQHVQDVDRRISDDFLFEVVTHASKVM